jgi:hypothetical protein
LPQLSIDPSRDVGDGLLGGVGRLTEESEAAIATRTAHFGVSALFDGGVPQTCLMSRAAGSAVAEYSSGRPL